MFQRLPSYTSTRSDEFWNTCVPDHWQVLPGLAVIAENKRRNAGLVEGQVLSLSYGRVVVKPVEKQRGLVPASYEGYQILDPGDIVIRPTDLQNDRTSIRIALVQDRGIITSAYIGLRTQEPWSTRYAYLYLGAVDSTKRIYGMGHGLRQQLGWEDLKRMPCLVPPVEEQAAIVKYLAHANTRVDKVIAAKRRLIALLDERDRSMVAEALSRIDAPTIPLKRALSSVMGGTWGDSPDESRNPARWCARVADFDYPAARVRTDTTTLRAVADQEFAKRALRVGDLLLEGSGGGDKTPVGRVVLFDHDEPAVCSNFLQRLRVRKEFDPRYLCLVLRSLHARGAIRPYINQTTGLQNLDLGKYFAIEVPIPNFSEQQGFVDRVAVVADQSDALRRRARMEIELLSEFRTRLVADVVTGQVDVRGITANLTEADVEEVGVDIAADVDELEVDDMMEMSEV